MSDFVCILRHKKHGTVICGWLTAKQYLEAGYYLDWDATNKEMQAALSQPSVEDTVNEKRVLHKMLNAVVKDYAYIEQPSARW